MEKEKGSEANRKDADSPGALSQECQISLHLFEENEVKVAAIKAKPSKKKNIDVCITADDDIQRAIKELNNFKKVLTSKYGEIFDFTNKNKFYQPEEAVKIVEKEGRAIQLKCLFKNCNFKTTCPRSRPEEIYFYRSYKKFYYAKTHLRDRHYLKAKEDSENVQEFDLQLDEEDDLDLDIEFDTECPKKSLDILIEEEASDEAPSPKTRIAEQEELNDQVQVVESKQNYIIDEHIRMENAFSILERSIDSQLKDLNQAALEFIYKNYDELSQTEEYIKSENVKAIKQIASYFFRKSIKRNE